MRSKWAAIVLILAVGGLFAGSAMAMCGDCGPAKGHKGNGGEKETACKMKKRCGVAQKKHKACKAEKSCPLDKEKCAKAQDCKKGKKGCEEECNPQTKCPVMGGEIKNKEQYVDVKGYRIYVCCSGCKSKIKDNPKKYIEKIKENDETPIKIAWLKKCKGEKSEKCDTEKKCCGERRKEREQTD